MNRLDFQNEKIEDVTLIKINISEATLQNASRFKNHVLRLIHNNERKLLIDCKDINYMDSTFLGSLVFSLKEVVKIGGDLKLIINEVHNPVWSMFEATQMFRVFDTCSTLDEALKSFS